MNSGPDIGIGDEGTRFCAFRSPVAVRTVDAGWYRIVGHVTPVASPIVSVLAAMAPSTDRRDRRPARPPTGATADRRDRRPARPPTGATADQRDRRPATLRAGPGVGKAVDPPVGCHDNARRARPCTARVAAPRAVQGSAHP